MSTVTFAYPTTVDGSVNAITAILDYVTFSIQESLLTGYIAPYVISSIGPFILILGITGNLLILLVLRRRELESMPSKPYLATLAVSDSSCLVFGLAEVWLRYAHGIKLRHYNSGCKIITYMIYVSVMTSSWLIVAVTADRFLCIQFPFRARYIRRKHRFMVITAILSTIVIINIHLLFGFSYQPTSEEDLASLCNAFDNSMVTETYIYFFSYIWVWADFYLTCAIPFFIITICNIGMIVQLKRDVGISSAMNEHEKSERKTAKQLTKTLIVVSSTFLITTSPLPIYLTAASHLFFDIAHDLDEFIFVMLSVLAYTNNAMNFLLYCVTGAKFREALKAMLCFRKL